MKAPCDAAFRNPDVCPFTRLPIEPSSRTDGPLVRMRILFACREKWAALRLTLESPGLHLCGGDCSFARLPVWLVGRRHGPRVRMRQLFCCGEKWAALRHSLGTPGLRLCGVWMLGRRDSPLNGRELFSCGNKKGSAPPHPRISPLRQWLLECPLARLPVWPSRNPSSPYAGSFFFSGKIAALRHTLGSTDLRLCGGDCSFARLPVCPFDPPEWIAPKTSETTKFQKAMEWAAIG